MKILKLTTVVALAVLGTLRLQGAQTNLVQTLQINLAAYTQGPTVTNGNIVASTVNLGRISNRQVIQALGAATANHFSLRALLLVVKPLPDGDPVIVVRDGVRTVNVTGFFSHDQADTAVARARVNTDTGVASGSEFSLHSFGLKNASNSPALTVHFDVSGLTRATFVSLLGGQRQVIGEAYDYAAVVSGTADISGTAALVQGTISGKGRRIEIIP